MSFRIIFVLFFVQKTLSYGSGGPYYPSSGGGPQFYPPSNPYPPVPYSPYYGKPEPPSYMKPPIYGPPRKCFDGALYCTNMLNALNQIGSGAQQIGNGSDVSQVKQQIDGPAQSSIINGNWTLLQIAADKTGDSRAYACLQNTANQSAAIADFIDTISPQLSNNNDTDKQLDVQRNLRSVALLYQELQTPGASLRIYYAKDQICANITAAYNLIDSGTQRIANGEDVAKVKAEIDGPQLSSDIRYNYNLLIIISNRIYSRSIEDCMHNSTVRAQTQVSQIVGILPQLTASRDLDKVNAVFKAFRQLIELQMEHLRCDVKSKFAYLKKVI